MYVNNEIGTVQPIVEIGKMIRNYNQRPKTSKLVFHTDATQAVNYFDCDVNKLNVDMLSMSAHKIYGPKGIGALYIRSGVPVARVQQGGAQEDGKRAGTHNVPGIVGLGAAVLMVNEQRTANNKIKELRDYLIKRVLGEIKNANLNGSKTKRSPNNANFSFSDVEGESLILFLDSVGIAASTGSACSSGSLEPSHVLLSLGLRHEQAHGSLRITLGKQNTRKEIDIVVSKLKKIVEQLRKVSGNVLNDYYSKKVVS
jgi:cysteine desulfurase